MSREVWVATTVALALGGVVVGATILSAVADEPLSAFADESPALLVEEAMAQGLETSRLLSGPQGFRAAHDHEPQRTLLVLIAPERPYGDEGSAAVRALLEQGGRVLVADNFGHANSVTADLGITFERVRLVEGAEGGRVPATVAGVPLDIRISSPTALHLDPGMPFRVLAESSADSFLDRDGDGLVNAWEPPGPFPLLAEAEVGGNGGRVVALSDPTVLQASAGDNHADNAAFLRAILTDLLPEGGRVVVDESRQPTRDPWLFTAAAVVGATTSDPWRQIVGILAVGFLVVAGTLVARDAWRSHRFDIDRFIRREDLSMRPSRDRREDPEDVALGRPVVRWSRRGKAAVGGGVVLAALGLALGNEQATYAAAFMLLGAALAVWSGPAHVRAGRRIGAHRLREGGSTPVDLFLEAVRGHTAEVEVLDALPPEVELDEGHNWFQTTLHPKKAVEFQYTVRAGLRGPHPVGPLKVRTSDVFRLRALETVVEGAQEALVLPRSDSLSRIPFKSKIPLLTLGPHLVNRAGDGTEFHALRDYQSGDSIRIVNWKASARTKELVVNQRVHESMATITVFLDARAIAGAGTVSRNPLNEGCRATLSIVNGALQARDKVRVFVYGDGVQELCPRTGRSKAHEMSDELARLEPAGTTTFGDAVEETLHEMKTHSPFVLVSGLEDDPTVLEGLKLLRQRAVIPFVIVLDLGTKPFSDEEEPEPDDRRIQERRKKMIAEIQSTDVPALPAVPGMPLGTLFQVGMR